MKKPKEITIKFCPKYTYITMSYPPKRQLRYKLKPHDVDISIQVMESKRMLHTEIL